MSDIKGTIYNFTKSVTKTSGDLFKTTRLSMSVSSEQNNLKNLYSEIGKKVHEIYQYGGSLGKYFDEKYLEIEACERKINELKEQISQIKGVRECPKCGKSADRVAEFCPKCGVRFGALSAAEASPTPPTSHSEQGDISEFIPTAHARANPETNSKASPAIETTIPISIHSPKPAAEAEPKTRRCRVCGMENDASTKFCLSCGRIVD